MDLLIRIQRARKCCTCILERRLQQFVKALEKNVAQLAADENAKTEALKPFANDEDTVTPFAAAAFWQYFPKRRWRQSAMT
mmetsp:Transcript_11885/g.17152  ORF Transcript_11885/g.17152 Transcript_11885/m.17152 type:complete len:81 (+) Transcript_11885:1262-1504(+)